MKNSILILLALFSLSAYSYAQTADDILGTWKSEHGSGQIEILKRGDLYFGKLVWLKEPNDEAGKPKLDKHNPSEELRNQPVIGLELLKNFQYNGKNTWGNGKVYNPKNGNTYNAQLTLIDEDKLNMRAYFGIALIGKTETWTRVK